MIRAELEAGNLAAELRRIAAGLGNVAPMLEFILEDLEKLGQAYAERAQDIPLAKSTVRRKQYARESTKRFQAKADRRAETMSGLQASAATGSWKARRALGGFKNRRGKGAITAPKPNAKILERVGGFLESFTPVPSRFEIRKIDAKTGTLRFGTTLGGLWKLHGAGYLMGRKDVTEVPARFPFGFSEESREQIAAIIENNQRDFVQAAVRK